ncbi:DinB family protein [Streptomyces sp. NPDC051684]|uniref:DinB family protein n=1 Tax=Streptomyces sp. NPDC051684 TaxID=3365670 RepID=UPI00379EBC4C
MTGATGEPVVVAERRSGQRPASVELGALKGALDRQREHVLGILEGLSEDDLRRPALPSGWSCLALVRHLTVDVERFWFPGVVAGAEDVAGQLTAGAEPHWYVPEGMGARQVFAEYRAAIARADGVLADVTLDQEPAAWPVEIWPAWRLPDVRHILIHVLTEVACHSGHLDAAREVIDGTTWLGGSPYAG